MTMKFAWTLFVFSVTACILFSLGRYVGRSEISEEPKKKRKRSPDLKADLLQFNFDNDVSKDEDCEIIDAEYENVVVDLQKFIARRELAKIIQNDSQDEEKIIHTRVGGSPVKTAGNVSRFIKKYEDNYNLE